MGPVPLTRAWISEVYALESQWGDVRWSLPQLESELTLDVSRFFVLLDEAEKEVKGYAGYWKVHDEAQVSNLCVAPKYRRQGLGRQLVECLLDRARVEKCQTMNLEVRAHNTAARALYASLGFREVGLRKNFYDNPKDDAVLMELFLNA